MIESLGSIAIIEWHGAAEAAGDEKIGHLARHPAGGILHHYQVITGLGQLNGVSGQGRIRCSRNVGSIEPPLKVGGTRGRHGKGGIAALGHGLVVRLGRDNGEAVR